MKKNIKEPLELLTENYGVRINDIKEIVTGIKYTAVLLTNGNIGVCANLGYKVKVDKNIYYNFDLDNFSHRIVLNSYFNALLNYSVKHKTGDIFEQIDFNKYNQIVMVGLFKPVVNKFREDNIPITIFDYRKSDLLLASNLKQKQFLKEADAVILTSTSIFNKTFCDVVNKIKKNCEIFLLGPSSIMSEEILRYRNIKMIFGSSFNKFDEQVLKIIENDGGTKKFLPLGQKRIFIDGEINENVS